MGTPVEVMIDLRLNAKGRNSLQSKAQKTRDGEKEREREREKESTNDFGQVIYQRSPNVV